jgi:hypothetical protein
VEHPSTLPPQVLVPDPSGPPEPPYPALLQISRPGEMNRWLPLVKWLLVIPNLFVLAFVAFAAFFVWLVGIFAVLFTARWPRGMFDFLAGMLRWSARANAYAYLMTDRYPPFALRDDPEYPIRFDVEYPEHTDRWRPLVQWLLVLPYSICAAVLSYLLALISFAAFFAVLITKRIPDELFEIMVVCMRWTLRAYAYGFGLTSRYPPWTWA